VTESKEFFFNRDLVSFGELSSDIREEDERSFETVAVFVSLDFPDSGGRLIILLVLGAAEMRGSLFIYIEGRLYFDDEFERI